MPLILHIETATTNCSVALSDSENLLTLHEVNDGYKHAEVLPGLIKSCLDDAGNAFSDLDAVAISMGPGSYTGLRIGSSAAKGLAYGLDIPVIGIETLEALARHPLAEVNQKHVRLPMLDARRMEVYVAAFNGTNRTLETEAHVVTESSFEAIEGHKVLYGPGADKLEKVLGHRSDITIAKGIVPTARDMVIPAYGCFRSEGFLDTAYFEPFYLKDFIAGKPKSLLKNTQ